MSWMDDEREALERTADARETRRQALAPLTAAERRWIARLRRVIAAMPTRLTVIANDQADGCTVYAEEPVPGHDVGHVDGRIGSIR